MEPQILLAKLRALLERAPNFETYSPNSKEHQMWLGQAHALVSRWNKIEGISFKSNCNFLSTDIISQQSVTDNWLYS